MTAPPGSPESAVGEAVERIRDVLHECERVLDELWREGKTTRSADFVGADLDLDTLAAALAGMERLEAEVARWLAWSGGQYPDDSPGDVIHAYSDGTIILDDGITTWEPLRALAWIERRREANAERATREALGPPKDAR